MRLFEGTPFDRPPRCEQCGELEPQCNCPPAKATATYLAPEAQTPRLRIERRKHAKTVTVIDGLRSHESDLPLLLTKIKSACGTGGTVKEEALEIQGDHLRRAGDFLRSLGYRVKM